MVGQELYLCMDIAVSTQLPARSAMYAMTSHFNDPIPNGLQIKAWRVCMNNHRSGAPNCRFANPILLGILQLCLIGTHFCIFSIHVGRRAFALAAMHCHQRGNKVGSANWMQ